jgi:tight adherence protein B
MSLESLISFLAVFAVIAVVVLATWLIVAGRLEKLRRFHEHRMGIEPGADAPLIVPPPSGSLAGRFDQAFQVMLDKTLLNIEPLAGSGLVVLTGVVLAGIVFVWRIEEDPWMALPAFIVGATAMMVFLWWRNRKWRNVLRNQLPDALYLLARALRAGRSLEQSFQLVGDQGVAPLSREFARMYRQLELGLGLNPVLEMTARRLDVVDFNVFAAVLAMHRPTGGNLPTLLDRLAAATRERIQFEGQYRAATAMGRVSAGFILLMVGIIMLYFFFVDREVAVHFFETSTGMLLFAVAAMLEIVGGVLLFFLLRFDV